METSITSVDTFFPHLQEKYHLLLIDSGDPSQIFLRSSISSKDAAETFIKDFAKFTKTGWNVAYEIKTPMKCTFHKLWCCQFSYRYKASYRYKTPGTYRNKNCLANINIFVKKITIHTKRTDEYMRRYPPLAAIIKIKCEHSHPIDSISFLRMRRVTDETKARYDQYFEMGLSIPESKYLHGTLLEEEGVEDLEDAAVNPSSDQVAYIYKLWKTRKDGGSFNSSGRTRQIVTQEDNFTRPSTFSDAGSDWADFQSFDVQPFENEEERVPQKRSLQSPEIDDESVSNTKRIKILSNQLNCGVEDCDSDAGSFAEHDRSYLYDEIHKKFDLMDEESSRVSEYNHKKCEDRTDEPKSSQVVTYFVFEPQKSSNRVCEVSDSNAIESAKTLLKYMENHNDTDLADIITVRRYLRKLRDKVEVPQKRMLNL